MPKRERSKRLNKSTCSMSTLTQDGIFLLKNSNTAKPTLCVKHIFRCFPTARLHDLTGLSLRKVFEVIVTDGSAVFKCYIKQTELVTNGQLKAGSTITVLECEYHFDHIQKKSDGSSLLLLVLKDIKLEDAHHSNSYQLGRETSLQERAEPLLKDRHYYLNTNNDDISHDSACHIVQSKAPLQSSLKKALDERETFVQREAQRVC